MCVLVVRCLVIQCRKPDLGAERIEYSFMSRCTKRCDRTELD